MKKDKGNDVVFDRFRLKSFSSAAENLFAENKLMRFCMVCMVIWSAFNTVLLNKALKTQKTIIQPADESYKYEITSDKANDSYLYRMARHISFLVGNLTAGNARDQFNELLRLIHPQSYGAFQERFNTLAKEAERYPNISYFIVINSRDGIRLDDNKIIVKVLKNRLVGRRVGRKVDLEYQIEYVIEEGRFWIVDIREIGNASEYEDED